MADEILSGDLNPPVEDAVLPSEEAEVPTTDDYLKTNTHDNGKLFGRFESTEEALEFYKKQEVTHTNNMRELKDEQKAKTNEVQSVQADLETEQTRVSNLSDMTNKLIDNGMSFSDEMISQLEEQGLNKFEIESTAYKAKEAIEVNYATAGGKEAYDGLMEYATTIYDETQQDSILRNIKDNQVSKEFRELAILGLKAKQGGVTQEVNATTERIVGKSANESGVKGYGSQQELFADRRASQNSPAMKAKYLAKLAITDNRILTLH